MYNMEKQTEKFNERFGKDKKITESNIKKCNYFSRNHLTPHADFAKVSEQELTYYFQNCVPGEYTQLKYLSSFNLIGKRFVGKQSMNIQVRI